MDTQFVMLLELMVIMVVTTLPLVPIAPDEGYRIQSPAGIPSQLYRDPSVPLPSLAVSSESAAAPYPSQLYLVPRQLEQQQAAAEQPEVMKQPSRDTDGLAQTLVSPQPSIQLLPQPSVQPSIQPLAQPLAQPSAQPSVQPLAQPSAQPSVQPLAQPSAQPSVQPLAQPSAKPSELPSVQPTVQPKDQPIVQPKAQSSRQLSAQPNIQVSAQPLPPPQTMGMPYEFEWSVEDSESSNRYSHQERSDGRVTSGEYTVLLPDGRIQTVTFVDRGHGYEARVVYQDSTT